MGIYGRQFVSGSLMPLTACLITNNAHIHGTHGARTCHHVSTHKRARYVICDIIVYIKIDFYV